MAFLRDSEVLLCAYSQINKAVWLERRESMAELGQVSVPPDFFTSTAVTVTLLVSPPAPVERVWSSHRQI